MKRLLLVVSVFFATVNAGAVSGVVKGDGAALTKERMKTVLQATKNFYTDCGFYPKSIYGLIVDIDNCKNWGPEPYLKKTETLSDVWSRPLELNHVSDKKLEIKSLGPTDSDKTTARGEIILQGP